jgi:hypothetical protein
MAGTKDVVQKKEQRGTMRAKLTLSWKLHSYLFDVIFMRFVAPLAWSGVAGVSSHSPVLRASTHSASFSIHVETPI